MAYDDIRISELPSLPEIHNNDLFLIQDVTNNLAHRLDWGRLKNNIGRLSKGIIFPLGTEQEPEIAIGDYTSGIMAEDYGTFVIVTHGEKRFKVNQAGSMELINGNVVIGNYDRQCTYALIVNNIATFNCYAKFGDDLDVDGNLDAGGNITGGKDLNIPGNVILGSSCEDNLIINSEIRAYCSMDLKGSMAIHESLTVDNSARILHDVALGTDCSDKFDVYSNAWFRCDLRVDGDLTFGGDLVLDGDISIGGGCDNNINLYGQTTVHCDLRVKGDTFLEQNLYVNQNASVSGNFAAMQDVYLGDGCQYTTTINSTLTAECTSFFRGDVTIGDDSIACPGTHLQVNGVIESKCDTIVHEDLTVDHNTTLGTDCNDDLLVKATPVFECDASFEKGVNITETLYVGGDFTTDSHITDIGDNRGCTNPNLINLHGEVHIDCNLFVSGDVFYDGDLSITGPDITFGAGCGLSTIHLQGYTIAHCDMLVKGDTAPFALTVEKNVEIKGNTEMRGTLNVAMDSAHDANLYVHEDTLLNLPVPAYDYWEQCECVDLTFPNTQKRGPDQTTFIHGTQKSLCQVYLNDPRWYKPCEGDSRDGNNASAPHVQNTSIYGHLNSRSNVDLNSASADSATINHKQITNIWAKLNQYSLVELNKGIDTSTGACGYNSSQHATTSINFNDQNNKRQTIIHGDLDSKKNVILNSSCDHLTQVKGKLQTQCDVYLNGNYTPGAGGNNNANCGKLTKIMGVQESFCDVYLNGQEGSYSSNTYKDCGKETIVWGKFYASCDQEFGNTSDVCQHTTTLHTNLMQDAKVELNKSSGCCAPSNHSFNDPNNNRCTIIHGDLDVKASVILNRGTGDHVRINGTLDSRTHGRINGNVNLNGGANGTTKTCGNTTDIWGTLKSHCNVELNDSCSETTTIKGELKAKCNVEIDKNLTVHGDSVMDGTLLVKKDITGNANLTIKGNTTLGSGCPGNTVTMNAKTLLKATEIAGSLKATGGHGGKSDGSAVPDEFMALTSGATGESCGTPPKWNKIVNSISIPTGGALAETNNKKTGNLELDVAVCPDGGILVDNSCGLKLDDKAKCIKMGIIQTERVNNKTSGNLGTPGIVIGDNGSSLIGFSGDPKGRIRLVNANNIKSTPCEPDGGKNNDLAYFDGNSETYKNTCIGSGSSKKYMVCNPDGSAQRVQYDDFPDIPEPCDCGSSGGDSTLRTIFGISPLGDQIKEEFYAKPKFRDRVIPSKFDTNVPISISTVDVEATLDQIIGTDLTKGISDGIIEWRRVSDAYRAFDSTDPETGEIVGENPANPEPHFPIFDAVALSNVHPSLVRWDYTEDSYDLILSQDDLDSIVTGDFDPANVAERRLKPAGERTVGVTRPNYPALQALLFAAVKRLRQNKADKLNASQMVDAVDDAAAAAAGVAINETYRNGSQLMIRVS